MGSRQDKAEVIWENGDIFPTKREATFRTFEVDRQSSGGRADAGPCYEVTWTGRTSTAQCTCADHRHRGSECKHILAVYLWMMNDS